MKYRRTILHIDDDPAFTRIIATRLENLGYEMTALDDPDLAMEELDRSNQRLVLLDIDMPGISGLDLLHQIKMKHGGTQVIMVTGMVTMQTVLQSFRWGAEFCVFKPVEPIEPLLEAIERTFWRIDQWWNTIEYVSQQRRAAKSAAAGQPAGVELLTAIESNTRGSLG